jgi:VWFA-related protein
MPFRPSLPARRAARWVAAAVLTHGHALAQPPAPPRGAVGDSMDVRTLEIAVRVEDRGGAAMRGLEREDFQVRLAGDRSRVQAVSEVVDDRLDDLVMVILVDHRSLAAADRDAALEQLANEVDALYATARPAIAVASLDETLEVVQPPTTDPAKVKLALQGQQGKESVGGGRGLLTVEHSARTSLEEVLRELRGNRRDRVVAMASIESLIGEFRGYAQALHRETELELAALRGFVRSLGLEPGRKALLFVSAGMAVRPLGTLMQTLQQSLSGGATGTQDTVDSSPAGSEMVASSPMISTANDGGVMERDVSQELVRLQQTVDGFQSQDTLEALVAEANAGRISFYAARPTPAQASSAHDRDSARGSALELSDEKALLAELARDTGGASQLGEGGLAGFLASAAGDFAHYYSLALEPPDRADGAPIEVDVRVKSRGARVRGPSALVLARRVDQRLEDRTLAALAELPVQNPHQLELTVAGEQPIAGSAGLLRVELELTLPIGSIGLRAEGGAHRTDARVAVAVVDARGTLLQSQHLQVPLAIPLGELEAARTQYYRALIRLELPAGAHRLSLGLWDQVSGSSSFVAMPLVVTGRR